MRRLRIQAFGTLQVFAAEQRPVTLPAKKVQALLAYLALHAGRQQGRAKLAALLWSESNEAQARASLRQALLVLRKALALDESELVAAPGETIELREDCVDIDVRNFEALLDEGTLEALEHASRLYTADLLEGMETREPAFDDWLVGRRHHLRERAVDALSRLLQRHIESARLDRSVSVALRLLALDPLQETVHRTLMQLHARQGRPTAALRQFQLCRDALARELGTQPQLQTMQLRDSIEQERRTRPAPAQNDAEPPTTNTAELRHVGIVIAQTTPLSEDADPEPMRAVADQAAAKAAQIAARFGGTLEHAFGPGITVLFGMPTAHTNDVERAARCALALRDALPMLCLGVSGGIVLATGNGAHADSSFSMAGEALGVAARLAAAAGRGEVLVSESAWRSLMPMADGIPCSDATLPVSLRGTRTWRLDAIRSHASRTSLVGRRTELTQFATSLRACKQDGAGLTIHVRGEAGIGKSRLVDEFRAIAAAQGFACHGGTVLDFGSGAERDALRSLVQGLLGIEAENSAAIEAAVARAIADGLIDAAHEMHLMDLLHQQLPPALRSVFDAMDQTTRERAQNEVLAHIVRRCSEREPRLLVLEDLHWATPRALSRTAALAAATQRCAAVLVTTARGEGDPLDAAWRNAAGLSALLTFDLGPLRWEETVALAAQFGDANDAFAIRCVERSGGNPLFLEQLLQASRESAALPGSVQSVVQARLDLLGAEERNAIRIASVLGQRFPLAALNHLLGAGAWQPNLAQGLVRVDGNDGVFAHALVHEGAYASLPRPQRRELHAKAAQWFAQRDLILHAEHLDRADDPAAARAYLDAARAQAASHHHDRAARLAERGLTIARQDAPVFALACAHAEALYELGSMAHAQDAYEQAMAAARDDAERCRAWTGLAAVMRIRDDLAGAEAALARAEQAAAAHGLKEQLARIHFMRGNLLFPKGDLDGCQHEHERSLALARDAGSVELEGAALGGLGDAAFLRGHMLTARERFGDCVTLARTHDFKRVEAANLPMLAIACWYCGDSAGALESAHAAVAAAARIGHRRAEAIAHHGCYQFGQALLDFDTALAHADCSLELARQIHAPRFEAEALAFRGELLRSRGERAAALVELHQALEIARATGMSYMGPIFLGMVAAATDDENERSTALAEAEAVLAKNTIAHNHFLFRRDAIDASLQAGQWSEALRHAEQLESWARSQPLPWTDFFAARGRALARRGQAPNDLDAIENLRHLRIEGERLGQRFALIAIDAALSR